MIVLTFLFIAIFDFLFALYEVTYHWDFTFPGWYLSIKTIFYGLKTETVNELEFSIINRVASEADIIEWDAFRCWVIIRLAL